MGAGKSQFTEEELQDYQVKSFKGDKTCAPPSRPSNIIFNVFLLQDLTYFTKKEVL
jgi:hypothetical protein